MRRLFWLLGFGLLHLLPAQAATWTVCPDCALTSIRQALDAAEPGDSILVKPGTYAEGQLIIEKPIALIGIDYPVLDGKNASEILTIRSDSVWIEGFQIQNTGVDHLDDLAGIRIDRHYHFTILNNRIYNTQFGIYLAYANHGRVEGNVLQSQAADEISSGNGIHGWYCKYLDIRGNAVTGHRDGIYFEFVDSTAITENRSFRNIRYGLHFMFSNDDTYTDNQFLQNGAGVAVMFSKRINMYHNVFEHNWGRASYGLLLKEISDAEIRDNQFLENTIGIFVEGGARIRYEHNQFDRNGWAVKVSGGCLANHFLANNFTGNTMDLILGGNVNDNTFDGNFWSSYSGYDLNRDGVGDVPFRPVKLFAVVVDRTPESIILLRSFFIELLNFSEKVSPVLTPANVLDNKPLMAPLS